MDEGSMHELSAAYALDALDGGDLRAYEAHLARCKQCRADVASLREAATSLAYGVEPVAAPEGLERRIVTAARAERPNVVALRRRWAIPAAGLGAAAAVAAIALGIWATHLSHSLDRERSARGRDARVISILAQPGARQVPTQGGSGMLVVSPTREAVLVANGLPEAGGGKTYEAWVIEGNAARPAGLFRGGSGSKVLRLTRPVAPGATVGVTLERAGGSKVPTGTILLRATS